MHANLYLLESYLCPSCIISESGNSFKCATLTRVTYFCKSDQFMVLLAFKYERKFKLIQFYCALIFDHSVKRILKVKLLNVYFVTGCIIFGSDQEVAGVMRAVRRNNATGSFSFIGSDGWSARSLVSDGNEAEVEGTLSVQPQSNPVKGFEEYFLSLNVENNRRNPWFVGKCKLL